MEGVAYMIEEKEKERKVYDIFQKISSCYDPMNDLITLGVHRLWKKKLIESIPRESRNILDICCGTGDIAMGIGASLRNSRVTALDFSSSMLQIAEEKAQEANLKNIEFVLGDALNLPFRDNTFDTITISFGLRNTSDYGRVLEEIRRVLKPRGHFFCMEASYPDSRLLHGILSSYCRYIVPLLGKFLVKSYREYSWLNESVTDFLSKEELTKLIEESGFIEVKLRTFLFGSCTLHSGIKGG